MPRIHDAAARGFERGAEDYEKGRPSYPAEAIAVLVERCGLGPGCEVVDVGAGTGKFTRLLVAAGATVTAVEPVPGMRAQLVARSPEVIAVDGTAEHTGLPDACADLVTIAQAFHWFDHAVALREVARILRPGGSLALIWNTRDLTVPWQLEVSDLMDRLVGDLPRYRSDDPSWLASIDADPAFGPVESAVFDNRVPDVDLDIIRARVASTSYVSALPDDEREAVLAEVDDICRRGPIAVDGPVFHEQYRTDLFWCRRLG